MTPGEKRSKQHNTVLIPVMALTADPLCDQPHRNPALHASSPPAMATDVGHRGCTPSRNSSLCWWLHTGHHRTMGSPQVRWNSWQHCFFDQQSQTRSRYDKQLFSLNNSVPSFHYEKTLNMPRNAFAHISCESLHLPKAGIIYLS